MTSPRDDQVFRLLTVCTANRCRSPMAEAIARQLLEERSVDAVVASSGTLEEGRPASPGAVRAVRRRGLDLSHHESHNLDIDTVEAADLILTMERRHISSVAEVSLEAVRRTFTLTEMADLAVLVGTRHAEVSAPEWVRRADAMRHPSSVMVMSEEGDIEDPMGGPGRAYRRTATQIEELLTTILGLCVPTT